MREIHTEIRIHARPRTVWDMLLDFDAYPAWNPFITRITGTAHAGARLECRPRLPGSRKPIVFRPRISRLVPEQTFAWTGHFLLPGLADGEHFFELFSLDSQREAGAAGAAGDPGQPRGVRLVHRQEYRGPLVPVLWPFFHRKARLGFQQMNEALKTRAEHADKDASAS